MVNQSTSERHVLSREFAHCRLPEAELAQPSELHAGRPKDSG